MKNTFNRNRNNHVGSHRTSFYIGKLETLDKSAFKILLYNYGYISVWRLWEIIALCVVSVPCLYNSYCLRRKFKRIVL